MDTHRVTNERELNERRETAELIQITILLQNAIDNKMRDDMTIKLTQKLPVIIRKDLTSSLQPDLVVMPTLHHMYYVTESMVNVL